AAFERGTDRRMRLEALKLIKRRQVGIFVVEMNDEADGHEAIVEMIEERAATGFRVERPALTVDDKSFLMLFRRNLPELLETDSVFLRIDAVAQVEFLHQLLRKRSAAAFRKQRVFGMQLHAGRKVGLVRAVARDAHVAGGHATYCAVIVVQDLGSRKSGINLNTQGFRLLREPTAHVAEAHDVVAVV